MPAASVAADATRLPSCPSVICAKPATCCRPTPAPIPLFQVQPPTYQGYSRGIRVEAFQKRDSDGGLTLYVQRESPGKDLETNWLPAPNVPFFTVLRLYWPKPETVEGKWTAPSMAKAN